MKFLPGANVDQLDAIPKQTIDTVPEAGWDKKESQEAQELDRYLGKEERKKGFSQIYLRWDHPREGEEAWFEGHNKLFYSPKTLQLAGVQTVGGDFWVPLKYLVWVLDPVFMYDLVFEDNSTGGWMTYAENELEIDPRTQEMLSGSPDDENQNQKKFFHQRQLAQYYLEQIRLFAELCTGRSYHSILQLEQAFSYTMLVSCMASHKLPFRLRAAFTSMLVNMYVDRYPQSPLRMPEPIQVLHGSDGAVCLRDVNVESEEALPHFRIKDPELLQDERPHYSIEHSDKFQLIEEFVNGYFQRIRGKQTALRKNQNEFTITVMQLVQKLALFGFYGVRLPKMDELELKFCVYFRLSMR